MPGVVGSVKRTPRFDARGGRKGKTDPQIRCSGYWIASLRSQWREERGAGLLYFVRNDGCEVGGLPRFARNDRERGLDCFTSFAMTGSGVLDCFISFAMTGSGGLDCFTSLAMTGGGVAGLLHFVCNDRERGCWIASLRSQWREGRVASLKRGGEWRRDSDFLFF